MALLVLRCFFLMVAVGLGASLSRNYAQESTWLVFIGIIVLALITVVIDIVIPRKRIDIISTIYFGTIVGALLSYVLALALFPLMPSGTIGRVAFQLTSAMILIYVCNSLLLQTRNDFRFIIPYVEFVKEVKGMKPYVLDTSIIMDGRIMEVVKSGVLDRQFIVPQFVVDELQKIADSSDKLRREKGSHGLDTLKELQSTEFVDFRLYDRELPENRGEPVDRKLVNLANHLDGKIITNDYNLTKVAKVHNVPVLNLNELANALRPAHLPGEQFSLLVKEAGEQNGQGVGYLIDGTKVVVEEGSEYIGKEINVLVTKSLQKNTGRMFFCRPAIEEEPSKISANS